MMQQPEPDVAGSQLPKVPRLVWAKADEPIPLGTTGQNLHAEYLLLIRVPGGGIFEKAAASVEEANEIALHLRHSNWKRLKRMVTDWADDTPAMRTKVVFEEVADPFAPPVEGPESSA